MRNDHDRLFHAFHDDHAMLGRGFHELSTRLAARDMPGAKSAAERLEHEAGPHIAFEERVFYPELRRLLDDDEVEHMYQEHFRGYTVICELQDLPERASLPPWRWDELLERSRNMETHIAECGALFGALGRLSPGEREELFRKLMDWRAKAPLWTEAVEPLQAE